MLDISVNSQGKKMADNFSEISKQGAFDASNFLKGNVMIHNISYSLVFNKERLTIKNFPSGTLDTPCKDLKNFTKNLGST